MAVHQQGTVLQNDSFGTSTPSSSSLWSAWVTRLLTTGSDTYPHACTLSSGQAWQTDGALTLPDSSGASSGGSDWRFSEYRGTRTNFDPRPSPIGGTPTVADPIEYGVTARIKMPDVLPTDVGDYVEAGVTILDSNDADSQNAYQLLWRYEAGVAHPSWLRLYRVTYCNTGHVTNRVQLGASNIGGFSLPAGSYFIITLRAEAWSTTQFRLYGHFDDSGVGTPTSAMQSIARTEAANITSLDGYCGVYLRQNGPHTVGPTLYTPGAAIDLTARVGVDWWTVEDLRPVPADSLFPLPATTTTTPLASVVLAGEANASGSSLTVQPDFALPLAYDIPSRDFRTSDGTLISSPATSATRRTWEMHWGALDATQRNTLDALWQSSESGVFTFTWTNPQTDEAVTLRTVGGDGLTIVEGAKGVYGATAVVQEVL